MNIATKIKEIYHCISPERKNNVRKKISDKFNISVDSVKVNWIYNGKTPEEHQEEVLKIVQQEAKEQAKQLMDIIE